MFLKNRNFDKFQLISINLDALTSFDTIQHRISCRAMSREICRIMMKTIQSSESFYHLH